MTTMREEGERAAEIVKEADRIAHTRGRRSANAYIERAIAALVATREREACNAEREACVLATCIMCREALDREGPEVEFQADPTPMWWHGSKECRASAIRARAQAREGEQ